MEGDKKRKRARSDPGLSRIPDSAGELHSKSRPSLTEGSAPEASPGAEGGTKTTKHAGGRPPGHERRHERRLDLDSRRGKAEHRTKERERLAQHADQVRLVVSAALNFPRIPVSSSATSLIHV